MERLRVRFEGRVQGVGFRATARSIAQRHPVTGWVRNEPDGSVLVEIQGDPPEVDAVLQGIAAAIGRNIRHTMREPMAVQESETGFSVQR